MTTPSTRTVTLVMDQLGLNQRSVYGQRGFMLFCFVVGLVWFFFKKQNEKVLHFLLYNLPHKFIVLASFSPYILDGS